MPIAYIQEFPATGDTSTTNYDSVKEKVNVEGDRPDLEEWINGLMD